MAVSVSREVLRKRAEKEIRKEIEEAAKMPAFMLGFLAEKGIELPKFDDATVASMIEARTNEKVAENKKRLFSDRLAENVRKDEKAMAKVEADANLYANKVRAAFLKNSDNVTGFEMFLDDGSLLKVQIIPNGDAEK